ncbi:hypothetical protein [Oscillatoria sp. FACHB-1406]|uniref:hypothetical protein n=1 Tax=Oscillatoria sp. FACHB-1406 TaxID=2692846 RepID=UPI001689B3F1|nr:hypothetical protein [Oscillatoria sp. FACHB-1406]MBD2579013.1 hypothetical protein [Oscillatoria sp. FACHB-1406]
MYVVTPEEIEDFRQKLANYPPALKALDEIEDCEGDLADAALSLAIRAGQEPQQDSVDWLGSMAKRCRAVICQEVLRDNLETGALDKAAIALANLKIIPSILAVPVLIYVLKQGLDDFCLPLEGKV